jgi:hypothetical protein
MLRIHQMHNWFGLSDQRIDEALDKVASIRKFSRLSLLEAIPDETTILGFRRLIEREEIAPLILKLTGLAGSRSGTQIPVEPPARPDECRPTAAYIRVRLLERGMHPLRHARTKVRRPIFRSTISCRS